MGIIENQEHSGICILKISGLDRGTYILGCRVRPAVGGSWLYASMMVEVTDRSLMQYSLQPPGAVVSRPGRNVTLVGRAGYQVDRCLFYLPPNNTAISLYAHRTSSKNTTEYRAWRDGKRCGVNLLGVQPEDSGFVWSSVWSDSSRRTSSDFIELLVATAPESPPLLTLNSDTFEAGDLLKATCVVKNSRPVANITWLLGDDVIRADNINEARAASIWKWNHEPQTILQQLSRRLTIEDQGKVLICRAGHSALPEGFQNSHKYTIGSKDACSPSPCGNYSDCSVYGSFASCSCQPPYIGQAPYCRPECDISGDCPLDKACVNLTCQDPCPGTGCGQDAVCEVVSHVPTCQCREGSSRDPNTPCGPKQPSVSPPRLLVDTPNATFQIGDTFNATCFVDESIHVPNITGLLRGDVLKEDDSIGAPYESDRKLFKLAVQGIHQRLSLHLTQQNLGQELKCQAGQLASSSGSQNGNKITIRFKVCTIKINGGLPEPQPLILKTPTSSNDGFDFHLPNSLGFIYLLADQRIRLACSGSSNYFSMLGTSTRDVIATCVDGTTFSVSDTLYDIQTLKCNVQPVHVALRTPSFCWNGNSLIKIGFELGFEFFKIMDVCFNDDNYDAIWSRFDLVKGIGGEQVGFPRPTFVMRNFYPDFDADFQYTKVSQLDTLARLLGSRAQAQRYINTQHFLTRGHFTAKADFVYGSQHRATFYYINAAPQWTTHNTGNWKTLEANTRAMASASQLDLVVYTGQQGILQLPDTTNRPTNIYLYLDANNNGQLRVPALFWKVVYDPATSRGVAFVGVNNPYLTFAELGPEYRICTDVCGRITWVHWAADDQKNGFGYCCDVNDFRTGVPELPIFPVTGLLA